MSDGDMAQAGISAFPDEDNLFRWVGTINGPQDSPYEGLILKLQLEFPETYPYKPPNCQFKVPFLQNSNCEYIYGFSPAAITQMLTWRVEFVSTS